MYSEGGAYPTPGPFILESLMTKGPSCFMSGLYLPTLQGNFHLLMFNVCGQLAISTL